MSTAGWCQFTTLPYRTSVLLFALTRATHMLDWDQYSAILASELSTVMQVPVVGNPRSNQLGWEESVLMVWRDSGMIGRDEETEEMSCRYALL